MTFLPGVSVITCTGGRPEALDLCCRYLQRQTYKGPLQWILVDDCAPQTSSKVHLPFERGSITRIYPEPCWTPGQNTLGRNLAAAIPYIEYETVVFMEDDDWYAADHIETLKQKLISYQIAGETNARYYHIPSKRCLILSNMHHASLCQTGIRAEALMALLNICRNASTEFIDIQLWEAVKQRHLYAGVPTCIGLKGLPGREGIGVGHRPETISGWSHDPDLSTLRSWIGEDVDRYRYLIEKPAEPPSISPSEFETFTWGGQTRYRCNRKWANGGSCEFDTYDLSLMKEHIQVNHPPVARPSKRRLPSTLLGPNGESLVYEEVDEFSDFKFKE